MATCKDCIHYEVCQYHITEETKMTVAECGRFKNKADYIEKPCKTVYHIVDRDGYFPLAMSKPIEYLRLYEVMNLKFYGYYKTQEEAEKKLEELKNGKDKIKG